MLTSTLSADLCHVDQHRHYCQPFVSLWHWYSRQPLLLCLSLPWSKKTWGQKGGGWRREGGGRREGEWGGGGLKGGGWRRGGGRKEGEWRWQKGGRMGGGGGGAEGDSSVPTRQSVCHHSSLFDSCHTLSDQYCQHIRGFQCHNSSVRVSPQQLV